MKHVPTLDELAELIGDHATTPHWYNTRKRPGWVIAQRVINAHGCNRRTTRLGWEMLMEKIATLHNKKIDLCASTSLKSPHYRHRRPTLTCFCEAKVPLNKKGGLLFMGSSLNAV